MAHNAFTYQSMLPGKLIKEALKERKLSQKEFAKEIGMQPSHISEIIRGKRKITLPFAQIIEEYLEISTTTLMSMQMALDIVETHSNAMDIKEIEAQSFLDNLDKAINVKTLLRGENLRKLSANDKLMILKEKFGITSAEEIISRFEKLEVSCFRRSAKTGLDMRMISTWVIKAEAEALNHKPSSTFSYEHCDELCERLAQMLHANKSTDNIQDLLSIYGIGFCEVSKLEHASIDGYSFMKGDTPYIVITGRYDRIDNFAFTIMHEIGHIFLRHTTDSSSNLNVDLRSFCDDDYSPLEYEADKFASERLISESTWKLKPSFRIANPWTIQSKFTEWAKKRNLNPWIVLGRLSHETGIYKFKSNESRMVHVQKGGVPMN